MKRIARWARQFGTARAVCTLLLFALVFIVLTLLADLLNAALDPRLRTV